MRGPHPANADPRPVFWKLGPAPLARAIVPGAPASAGMGGRDEDLLLSASFFQWLASPQPMTKSSAEQELLNIREAMSNDFVAALAKGDVATAVNEHYTVDAVYKSLCPNQPPAIGRDAYLKRLESAVKAGAFRDYVSKPDEAHLLSEDRGWTSGTFSLTVNEHGRQTPAGSGPLDRHASARGERVDGKLPSRRKGTLPLVRGAASRVLNSR